MCWTSSGTNDDYDDDGNKASTAHSTVRSLNVWSFFFVSSVLLCINFRTSISLWECLCVFILLFNHRHRLLQPFRSNIVVATVAAADRSLRIVNLECQWMIIVIIHQYICGCTDFTAVAVISLLSPPPPSPPIAYLQFTKRMWCLPSLLLFALSLSTDICCSITCTIPSFFCRLCTRLLYLETRCWLKKNIEIFTHTHTKYISINKTNYASIELVIDFIIYF